MVDKEQKTPTEGMGDLYQRGKKYMDEFADLFKLIPEEMRSISAEDAKIQKRKRQKVSLVKMEENMLSKHKEVNEKKKKAEEKNAENKETDAKQGAIKKKKHKKKQKQKPTGKDKPSKKKNVEEDVSSDNAEEVSMKS